MALASGGGAEINLPDGGNTHGWCFGEDQGRYVIATADGDAFARAAASAGVPVHAIGASLAASQLKLSNGDIISLAAIKNAHEGWLPGLMAAGPKTEGG